MNSEAVISSELFPEVIFTNLGVKERQQIKVQPRDGVTTYTVTQSSQQPLRFVLPNSYYANLHNIALRFSASITGGTTPSFNNLISCLFQRIRVLYNSTVLLDERNYNLKEMIYYYATGSNNSNNDAWLGVGNQATRRTWASGSGREYIMYPFRNLCEDKLFPVPLLNGNLYIELYPANPNTIIESATAVTNFVISNPVFIYDGIVPSQEYESQLIAMMNAGKCQYLWKANNYYINPMTSTNNQIRLPEVCKSLRKIYAIQRLGANIVDVSANNKLDNWAFNAVSQYSFKINGLVIPAEPVAVSSNASEAYWNMLHAIYDHSQLDDPFEIFKNNTLISYSNYTTDKFLIAHQFDKYKAGGANSITSGLDLTQNSAGILMNVVMSATADNNAEVFIERDVVCVIGADRNVVIIE